MSTGGTLPVGSCPHTISSLRSSTSSAPAIAWRANSRTYADGGLWIDRRSRKLKRSLSKSWNGCSPASSWSLPPPHRHFPDLDFDVVGSASRVLTAPRQRVDSPRGDGSLERHREPVITDLTANVETVATVYRLRIDGHREGTVGEHRRFFTQLGNDLVGTLLGCPAEPESFVGIGLAEHPRQLAGREDTLEKTQIPRLTYTAGVLEEHHVVPHADRARVRASDSTYDVLSMSGGSQLPR